MTQINFTLDFNKFKEKLIQSSYEYDVCRRLFR